MFLVQLLDPEPAKRPSMARVKKFFEGLNEAQFGVEVEGLPACAPPPGLLDPSALKAQQRLARKSSFRRSRLSLLRQVIQCVREAEGGGATHTLVPDPGALVKRLQSALSHVLGEDGRSATLPQFTALLKEAGLLSARGGRGGGATALLPSGTHPQEVFQLLDADESGDVSRCELLAGLAFLLAPGLDALASLTLVFHAYDLNGDGTLSKEELFTMLRAYRFPPCALGATAAAVDAQMQGFFQQLDEDHNGVISLEEFLNGARANKGLLVALEGGALPASAAPGPRPSPARRASSTPRSSVKKQK